MKRASVALALLAVPAIAPAANWTLEAGTALANEPDHLGAKSRRWLALPIVSATYGNRLRASIDDGLRWTAFDLGNLKLGPVVEYRTSYDRGLPAGFGKIHNAIEPGLFAELTTAVAVIESRVRKAVSGYGGWSADLAADTELPIRLPGTIGLEARAAWADRAFGRSRFGVDSAITGANRLAPYAADAYATVGAGAEWRLPLAPRIALIASVGADRLLTNGASPIVQMRTVVETGIGLTFRLR